MRLVLCVFTSALAAGAGVVKGTVLEHASGLPMARTMVQLIPVPKPGSAIKPMQMRAGRSGDFVFSPVPDGLYILTAYREGYFPASHGQRRPGGHGMPVQITETTDFFTQLRMRRKGAITGRVLDENGIGLAGVPVLAYRARLPFRSAGRAISDDRGVYRIHGLEAGRYWVRSAAHTLEDGSGRLPTFGPESKEIRDARVHDVRLDMDTPDADVRPEPGNLFRLTGEVHCEVGVVSITLSSETGRRTTEAACQTSYTFEGLAPAAYEVFAVLKGTQSSAFLELYLSQNSNAGTIQPFDPPVVDFEVRRFGSGREPNVAVELIGRRQELSESDIERPIKMPRSTLAPGYWEFHGSVPPGYYIESISGQRTVQRRPWRADRPAEWFDVFIPGRFYSRVLISVSDRAAHVEGTVLERDKTVPGSPVFLWPVEEAARRSLRGWRQTLSDVDGRFSFEGLPPGEYRLLATFDVSEVDEMTLDEAQTLKHKIEPAQTTKINLQIWNAP